MKINIEVVRYEYYTDRTIGKLFINDEFFCWTLEDPVRPPNKKVYGETAIPEGNYKTLIQPFRGDEAKMYPHLLDVPMFTGVCIHGGNVPEDTLGCILVGFGKDDQRIYNSAVKELVGRMQSFGSPWTVGVRNGG